MATTLPPGTNLVQTWTRYNSPSIYTEARDYYDLGSANLPEKITISEYVYVDLFQQTNLGYYVGSFKGPKSQFTLPIGMVENVRSMRIRVQELPLNVQAACCKGEITDPNICGNIRFNPNAVDNPANACDAVMSQYCANNSTIDAACGCFKSGNANDVLCFSQDCATTAYRPKALRGLSCQTTKVDCNQILVNLGDSSLLNNINMNNVCNVTSNAGGAVVVDKGTYSNVPKVETPAVFNMQTMLIIFVIGFVFMFMSMSNKSAGYSEEYDY